MKDNVGIAVAALLFLAIIGGVAWYNITVWNECRETNSWFYCVKIISK